MILAAVAMAAAQMPAAARAVVVRYYAAIGRRDYHAAYQCWDRGGAASGQSYAAFARGFAHTARVRVAAGAPTDQEGAAGSTYITVPVTVTATLTNGAAQRFRGSYVLRVVNDVPGATPAQLTWHIGSAKLRAF